ncbi:MAG: LysR family transcriptional regulator [Proteobacteria bacterium]|nr:LysR family transcriptional regulator [Pseudomonadota bacterium]MBU1596752.1 LysR family transcriptional regulator [Pseudomonadota bacterium]
MTTRALPSGSGGSTEAPEVEALHVTTAPRPTLRLHLWLENKGELFFGIGRAQLLFSIQQQGSLRKAAKVLGMSYRAAWGKIQQTEQVLGLKLVESRGQRRDGVSLTPAGEELADQFQAWFTTVERCALNSASTIFPFQVAKCSETDT